MDSWLCNPQLSNSCIHMPVHKYNHKYCQCLQNLGRQQVHGQVMTDTAELRKPEHTQTLCLSLTISHHLHCYILESKQSSSFFIQCQSDGFGKCCSLLLRLEEPSNYISLISLAYFCLSLQQINSMDCVSFVYCFI